MEFRRYIISFLALVALVGCAKEEEEEEPIFISPASVYQQVSPVIRLKYGSLLQLKNDFSNDGRSQTLSLVPVDTRSEISADPRLEIQYFASFEGVTIKSELQSYLIALNPSAKWVETTRFTASGFYQVIPDPDNRLVTMSIYYLLSDKGEVYRITFKPGIFGEVHNQISAAWNSLELQLKVESAAIFPMYY